MTAGSPRSFFYGILFLVCCVCILSLHPFGERNHELYAEKLYNGEGKASPEHLEPNELFFYDRNYPNDHLDYKSYRRLLEAAMAHDRNHPVIKRGLDAPWTTQGPGNLGGRVNTIAVNPADTKVMLIGFSQGGIFRTRDGGQNWDPVFDDEASLSISDIQFDPVDPNHVWATTGDVNISGYYFIGDGIYESRDGGLTWQHKGLKNVGILSKVAIDNNPNYLYVGSMGYPFTKGWERGLYRSTNGGSSWEKTLTIDDSTGIIDIVADPTKTGRVFASACTRLRSNVLGSTTCPGTSVYRSDDFGATWTNVQNGLPNEPHSRTGIEITNGGVLFVSYSGEKTCDDKQYKEEIRNIYKSTDAGQSWDTIPTGRPHNLPCNTQGQNGWYFNAISVNPNDPKDIFILGLDLFRTRDGGLYWSMAGPPWQYNEVHADKHTLVVVDGYVYLGTDGGAYRAAVDDTEVWEDIENISSTQFYRLTFNPHEPDQYFGGAQDNGTTGGNESMLNLWPRLMGGDGFQPLFDPDEPKWIFALTQNGEIWFSDDGIFNFKRIQNGLIGTRYWDMPFIQSPFNPKILYCGSNRLFKLNMNDAVREWKPQSDDLTKGILMTGGRYPALTAIAQSPVDAQRMYVGTQDGLVWTTANGGQSWTNISDGTPGVFVTSIACSLNDPLSVYVTYSGFRDGNYQPYIYHSKDAGQIWTPIGTNMPLMGVNTIFIMPGSEDKVLIVGTDGGVYVSFDGGDQWDRVGSNMPYFPVYDIDFNPITNQVVAATFARGIMTFPLDQLEIETADQSPAPSFMEKIKIYPTISAGEITIEIPDKIAGDEHLSITIIDIKGSMVEQVKNYSIINQKVQLNVSATAGCYFLLLQCGQRQAVRPFILQSSRS